MNIGQILETHLGWAARGLGEQVQAHLDEHYSPAKMRDRFKAIMAKPNAKKMVDGLDDDEVMDMARRHVRGVHTATRSSTVRARTRSRRR